jgi:hypothetical protein
MKLHVLEASRPVHEPADNHNRRLTERIPAEVGLVYSGMDSGTMLMGDGTVTNLSEQGIGICGNRLVKQGMDLALFIELPGVEEPVCIAESRVTWVSGRRFGVKVTSSALDAQNNLRFHVWNHRTRSSGKG